MKLAIFDFDGTLFPKDTLPFLLSQWKKSGCSKMKYTKTLSSLAFQYVIFKTGVKSKLSREEMKKNALRNFTAIFEDMSEDQITKFFTDSAQAIREDCNAAVIEEIQKAQAEGFCTILLSGTYEIMLNTIAAVLNIDTVIGTKMLFKNGIVDLNAQLDIVSGAAKLEKIKEYFMDKNVDWQASRSYADSISDLAILELVGQPVAVRPDEKLKSIAVEKGWQIID